MSFQEIFGVNEAVGQNGEDKLKPHPSSAHFMNLYIIVHSKIRDKDVKMLWVKMINGLLDMALGWVG